MLSNFGPAGYLLKSDRDDTAPLLIRFQSRPACSCNLLSGVVCVFQLIAFTSDDEQCRFFECARTAGPRNAPDAGHFHGFVNNLKALNDSAMTRRLNSIRR